jgi:hypothetical protein
MCSQQEDLLSRSLCASSGHGWSPSQAAKEPPVLSKREFPPLDEAIQRSEDLAFCVLIDDIVQPALERIREKERYKEMDVNYSTDEATLFMSSIRFAAPEDESAPIPGQGLSKSLLRLGRLTSSLSPDHRDRGHVSAHTTQTGGFGASHANSSAS